MCAHNPTFMDPIVLVHGRALLADDERTVVAEGDVRDPGGILTTPEVLELIDFTRPVAVILAAVLHFIPDQADPAGIVTAFRKVMAPGSGLVISHGVTSGDPQVDAATRESTQLYTQTTAAAMVRTREQVAEWFAGFTLIPPGLVDADRWQRRCRTKVTAPIVAGVGLLEADPTRKGTDTSGQSPRRRKSSGSSPSSSFTRRTSSTRHRGNSQSTPI
jgi:hypothetical protein